MRAFRKNHQEIGRINTEQLQHQSILPEEKHMLHLLLLQACLFLVGGRICKPLVNFSSVAICQHFRHFFCLKSVHNVGLSRTDAAGNLYLLGTS